MKDSQRLQHTLWECKYHLVFLPKSRRKVLLTALRKDLGPVVREVARREGGRVEEGHLRSEHVHRLVSIPPKSAVAALVGYLKGKSAVRIHRELLQERRMTGLHFWAAGYCVSTVGLDEAQVRQYIREQEEIEQRQGELQFD